MGAGKGKSGLSDVLLILGLLLVFVTSAFILVLIGADTYKKIAGDMESNFERRTPISYIASKIRKADRSGQVGIQYKEETDVLVIEEVLEGVAYETWIYEYKGSLYEIFTQKGTDIALVDGMDMIEIQGLKMERLRDNLLRFESIDKKGKSLEFIISLRSNQKK